MRRDINPMRPPNRAVAPAANAGLAAANAAPRCHARSKRTGLPCQAPAVAGWRVCRMHGAGGGHRAGPSHPSWRHGLRSKEWVEMRRVVNELVREGRRTDALVR